MVEGRDSLRVDIFPRETRVKSRCAVLAIRDDCECYGLKIEADSIAFEQNLEKK